MEFLFQSLSKLSFLKESGIKALKRLKIYNYRDLLFHAPYYYIMKSIYPDLNLIKEGEVIIVEVNIDDVEISRRARGPHKIWVSNDTGNIELVFFNRIPKFILSLLRVGKKIILEGKVKKSNHIYQIHHPDFIISKNLISKFEPIYPLSYGIINKQMHIAILTLISQMPEISFNNIQGKMISFNQLLKNIHQPTQMDNLESIRMLANVELLSNQIMLRTFREDNRLKRSYKVIIAQGLKKQILDTLCFNLTKSQSKVIGEIEEDLQSQYRMLRMLQGDVGSGKTLVALLTMISVVQSGKQASLMAPTDLLAKQHFTFFKSTLIKTGLVVELLTGSTTLKDKKRIYEDLYNGKIDILIGTHALFQEKVEYHNLAYVVIDEQHRFGVSQRIELTNKAQIVDLLVMTATPIPRSLTLTIFGDMPVSRLTSKPDGRLPIITSSLNKNNISQLYDSLQNILEKGEKIFWVCPLIENAEEKQTYVDVVTRSRDLELIFPNQVLHIHGKMKSKDKDRIMLEFKEGSYGILVATTVIEVGIDIKEASLIIIENAEKFGLAQIHQLRGRVGRSNKQSYCILLYGHMLSANAKQRIKILKNSSDGFVIAEEDLALRGGGDILGNKQSGEQNFYFADLARDKDLLIKAHKLALVEDPYSGQANLVNIFNKDKSSFTTGG